jgi:hypothetical protein
MELNQKIKNIGDMLEKLELGESSIEEVLLFCDYYQEIDYKKTVHRVKVGDKVIALLRLYRDKYDNDARIHRLKNESAFIMWDFIDLRDEAQKLRDEALQAQPDLIFSHILPPYWYEGKPFAREPGKRPLKLDD